MFYTCVYFTTLTVVKFPNLVCTDLWVLDFLISIQLLILVHSKMCMLFSSCKLFLSIERVKFQFYYKSGNIFRITIGTYINQYEPWNML